MKSSFKYNGVKFNIDSGMEVNIDLDGSLRIDSVQGTKIDLESVPAHKLDESVFNTSSIGSEKNPYDFTVHGAGSKLVQAWKKVGDTFFALTNSKTGSGIRNCFYAQGKKVELDRKTKTGARKNHIFEVQLVDDNYYDNYHAKLARKRKV
jgi:hypothetical protein